MHDVTNNVQDVVYDRILVVIGRTMFDVCPFRAKKECSSPFHVRKNDV